MAAILMLLAAASVSWAAESLAITQSWSPGDSAIGLAADHSGNVLVIGRAYYGFHPTANAPFPTAASENLSYLVKFNAQGEILHATYLPGQVGAVAAGADGVAYVVGNTVAPDSERIFVYVLGIDTVEGKVIAWLRFGGTTGVDAPTHVALDAAGAVSIAGRARSRDFPVTADAFQRKPGCPVSGVDACEDIFLLQFDPQASRIVYATFSEGARLRICTT
jgi:hypothetical protein